MMARLRSRHFTAVTTLGPREAALEHSKVVVSWLDEGGGGSETPFGEGCPS